MSCSKSGYYAWVNLGRPKYKAFNDKYNQLVLDTYTKNNTWGIRSVRMKIKEFFCVSLKNSTIQRYMKINNIKSITRKRTHRYAKVHHYEISNLLKRNFNCLNINEKWSIDISYIFAVNGMMYLCAIKDMYDKSIVSYKVSNFIDLKLVLDTVKQALKNVPYNQRKNLILHSDQGWHFTNWQYVKLLKENNIQQSISSKGSCVDNVPIESFFSILKSECIYPKQNLQKNEIPEVVKNFIMYCNNERLQEKIQELAPMQFRQQILASLFLIFSPF